MMASPRLFKSLKSFKPTKLKILLVSATVFSVGVTAVMVHLPWKFISTENTNDLTTQINQEIARNASLEVESLFKSAQASHIFLQKASDRNITSLDRRESMAQVFFSLLESRPDLTWIMFGYPNGDFFGVQRTGEKSFDLHWRQWNAVERQSLHTISSYNLVNENLQLSQQKVEPGQPPYYSPDRPWYKEAIKHPGEVAWLTYIRRTNSRSSLDSAITVNKDKKMIGVLNIGIELDHVSRSLQKLQNNKKGTLFITNRKSELLASSDSRDTLPKQVPGQDDPQFNILESANNPLLRGLAQELKVKNIQALDGKKSQNFRYRDPHSGEINYVSFIPLNQLDWVIGIVTPESLYVGEIRRKEMILVIAIIGCLLLTTAFSINLINRLIVRPILKLNWAARQIAEQTFSEDNLANLLDRPDEIGELAHVINEMAQQINGREQGLRNQMKKLERETEDIQRENSQGIVGIGSNHPYDLIQRAKYLRSELEREASQRV